MADLATNPATVELDRVIIRFAGDSGDGMQLTGDRFTSASALFGNDLATLPDFPAEIRAPAGTVAGVSAFQVHISDHEITTPGDAPNVLVVMNPAALKSELHTLAAGGTIILNSDAFEERSLTKAGYDTDPRQDKSLDSYTVYEVPMTSLTKDAVASLGVKPRDAERSKNFFALGLLSWMYTRPTEPTVDVDRPPLRRQAAGGGGEPGGLPRRPRLRRDRRAVRPPVLGPPGRTAARHLHEHQRQHGARLGPDRRQPAVEPAAVPRLVPDHAGVGHPPRAVQAQGLRRPHAPGRGRDRRHRRRPRRRLRWSPRRDHHERTRHRAQVRDDGPGGQPRAAAPDHRHPARRARPPACRPRPRRPTCSRSCTAATASRRSPWSPRRARRTASTPPSRPPASRSSTARRSSCCPTATSPTAPSRGACPTSTTLPDISVPFASETNHVDADGNAEFWPYLRDPETLARPWAVPGTPELMHRIGGIEKADGSGNISYDPANHERMVHLRAQKVAGIANDIPLRRGGRRRRRRRDPGARLGLDLGRDRRGDEPLSGPRAARGPRAPRPPQPVPPQPRRRPAALPAGARPRAEPRPAVASCSAPTSSSTSTR